VDEEQEQQMELEFLVYGTRTSKDKSGAYLFLPDSEAKVPERPHRTGGTCAWGEPGRGLAYRVLPYCPYEVGGLWS
jgi:hypothetical protein